MIESTSRNLLLSGRIADAAGRKIHEIAETLAARDYGRNGYGLMTGNTGTALFFYHYWRWSGRDDYYERASDLLLDAMDRMVFRLTPLIVPADIPASLYGGIGGVGWSIGHLIRYEFIEGDISDTMGRIEPWLFRSMIYDLRQNRPDLFRGAAGIGLYAVGRDNRLSKEYLRRFVTEFSRTVFEERIYDSETDCSIAGGMGAMILLLVRIGAKHPDLPQVPALLDYFGERLTSCCQAMLRAEVLPDSGALGWNDSVLSMLWVALCSRLVDSAVCDRLTDRVIEAYRGRIAASGPFDSGMAGGLVSAAHILNRMYRLTGKGACGKFARTLYEAELDAAAFIDPASGYEVWLTESDGFYGVHTGLLNGLAGIGLALMDAVSDKEPVWDECLMMG